MSAAPFCFSPVAGSFLCLPLAATTRIFRGSLVALDATKNAVPATDTAGLIVQGVCDLSPGFPRADEPVDGSKGKVSAVVRGGVFRLRNSAAAPLSAADLGKLAVVEDESTAAKSSAHRVAAGVLLALEPGSNGNPGNVWLWIMPPTADNPGLQTFDLSQPVPA